MQTATVMFNGSLYQGTVVRTTAKRALVRFDTGTGLPVRENWFTIVARPEGRLVSRRERHCLPGDVTILPNTAILAEPVVAQ